MSEEIKPEAKASPNAAAQEGSKPTSVEDRFYPETEKVESKPTDKEVSQDKPADASNDKPPESSPENKELEAKKEDADKEESKEKEDKPASAEYKLSSPKDSLLSPEHLKEVEAYAKKHSLTNEQAQEILNRDNTLVKSFLKTQLDDHEVRIKDWEKAIEKDPELGGDKFKETVVMAKKAIDKLGSPELKKLLNDSGYGSHPEVMRVFAKVGREFLADDKFVHSGSKAGAPRKSIEDSFYGES